MIGRLRTALLAFALAAAAGAAAAADYIVVASNDPAIARGAAYDSGAKVPLAAGRTLTLMHASGDTIRVKGAANGVVLPGRRAGQGEAERLAMLRIIVAPPQPQAKSSLYATRTRAGICPDVAAITTLDAIVQVYAGGCASEAAQALEAWLAGHPPTDA